MAQFGKPCLDTLINLWDIDDYNKLEEEITPWPTPAKTKPASAAVINFEMVDLNQYQHQAKCVTYKTSKERMILWLYAFKLRYYDWLALIDVRLNNKYRK